MKTALPKSPLFWPLTALLALLTAAFCLAAYLSELGVERSPNVATGGSVMSSLLGGSRAVLSENLYEKADTYFHFGMAYTREEAMQNDPFKRLAGKLNPHAHVHADDRGVTEIMPWLKFATEMDPHNVEAYLVAAYWLTHGAKEPGVALEVLRQAALNNPNDYRILTDRAVVYMIERQPTNALHALNAALRVWPSGFDPDDEQMRLDLSRILTYRAFIFESDGDAQAAVTEYEKALALFPEKENLRQHIVALKAGDLDEEKVQKMWDSLFKLSHDDHDHHHHEGEEEHSCMAGHH
ncbi:MAG: hypothetical protein EOM20_05095 [Spartobacteria bacterium]|nr:hypothetical protein [Spartobacteria bacterium]